MTLARNPSFETHSGWGAAVTLAASGADASLGLALIIGLAAGVAVEVIQWAVPAIGQHSLQDILYTGVGACGACTWIWVMGG